MPSLLSSRGLGTLAVLFVALHADGESQLRCVDTDYFGNQSRSLFNSELHVLQLYGEAGQRSTNFVASTYNGFVSSNTVTLIAPRLSEIVPSPLPLPDPFVGATVSVLTDLAWENRIDAFAGLEWRPFKGVPLPVGPLQWLHHLRLYAGVYDARYLREAALYQTRPQSDQRFGAELYRECNIYSSTRGTEGVVWWEVWSDVSWRRTNFVSEDFRSWTAAVAPTVGARIPPGNAFAVMPYVTAELTATERSEEWQNRVLIGGGIRFMPFRWQDGWFGDLARGSRFFLEGLWLMHEFDDGGAAPAVRRDVRGGITFVINRW